MKRFNFKFESDANMSRDELLSVPILKKPNIFTQMLIKPRVDYHVLAVYKNKHSLVRALDKIGLARVFLTLAALIVKGYSPIAYTETRSQNELAAMRVEVIDENIKFNSIDWDSKPSENIKQELSG